MRINIDMYNSLTLIPETHGDRVLIYHLLNCSDLKQFTEYLDRVDKITRGEEMTSDLDVHTNQIRAYLLEIEQRLTEQHLNG